MRSSTRRLADWVRWSRKPPKNLGVLSVRELEVFEYLVRGCGIFELADVLSITSNTVRQHRKAVFHKLEVHSHVELMRHYGPPQPVYEWHLPPEPEP